MEFKFESCDSKSEIPWWISKCSEEIANTFKLDLDIEECFLLSSIINKYYNEKDINN